MSDEEAVAILRAEGISVDPAEAGAAARLARDVGALVRAAADANLTLDETPWSYDTLRASIAAGDGK